MVGDYLSNICGTNIDLGVLVGGSVHVINTLLHSVGTLSVVIGTVVFSGDPTVTVLDDPSGNIIPGGQDTGLEFQFTVPSDPGDYGIFILIPSNDPLSPCTYGYVFSVAGGAHVTVSGPAGSSLCGQTFGPSYTPTGQFSIDDIIHSTGAVDLVIGTVTVEQGAEVVSWSADPNGQTIHPGDTFQMHGLINLPASGAFDIVVTINSNAGNSPCVYHYTGFIIEPITYQWQRLSLTAPYTWHDMPGETNSTLTIPNTAAPDGYIENPPPYNSVEYRCVVSCPSGVSITAYYTDILFWSGQNLPLSFPWSVTAVNDPLGATSVTSHTMIIMSDF